MKKLRIILTVFFILVTQTGNTELLQQTLLHQNETRSYYLYIPSTYNNTNKTPMLIALHGRNGDGQRMATLTDFNSRADQGKFIVVYPDGKQDSWNYLHDIPGSAGGADDSDFLYQVIDEVKQNYNIDSKRMYLTGISNGGFMTQRLACNKNFQIAAFASVAASAYAIMPAYCNNNYPVNILYLHGTEDRLVPWQGLGIKDDTGTQQRVTLSMTESLKFWSNRNGCSDYVTRRDIPPKDNSTQSRVRVFSANQCRGNTEVELYAIIGGGHNWPGVAGIIPESVAGQVNMDIHASDVIWSFFKDKRLQENFDE